MRDITILIGTDTARCSFIYYLCDWYREKV